jgi:methionyl-tRNA formyltransferase
MKSNDFKIIFFGTSDFAKEILKFLVEDGQSVAAIVTRPDKESGRNLRPSFSPVKSFALEFCPNIPILQPDKVSNEDFEYVLKGFEPDLFVVAAFGEIIKKNILQVPPSGSINVHPSLLPKYRGPSPLQTALLNGDKETGVCIIDVAEKMDAGDIFAIKAFPIDPDDNFNSLQTKALAFTRPLLLEVVEAKKTGQCTPQKQDESQISFCRKISAHDEKINWENSLEDVHNQIRALSEKPGAWSYLELGNDVKRVKIYASEHINSEEASKDINRKKRIIISKNNYHLSLLILQLEGKKKLNSQDFLAGLKTEYKFF